MSNSGVMGLGPRFRDLLDAGPVAGLDDAQLLARFLGGCGLASDLAFAAIVARHGPMVLGVCRRACLDPDDAADAFQATFLVLVRRARSVRVDDSLGRWLYGVSRRVARRARAQASRRRRIETGPAPLDDLVGPDHDPSRPIHRREQRATLDEELARLPAAFRAAVVLCDLEGRSIEDAAHTLGCPVGTVKSRLARGRAQLRDRLERRGLVAHSLNPAVPVALAEATTRAAVMLKFTPSIAAGMIPVATLALTQEVVTAMTMVPVKWLGSVVLISALTTGAVAGKPGQPDSISAAHAPDSKPRQAPPPNTSLTDNTEPMLRQYLSLLNNAKSDRTTLTPDELRKFLADPATFNALLALTRSKPGDAPPREHSKVAMPEYIVQPPDLLTVEVRQAGEHAGEIPIKGEKVVRPDGRISLDFYGELVVDGRTTAEIKDMLVRHLRTYFSDEELGLIQINPETGVKKTLTPAQSDAVKVEVSGFNSRFYYVLGDVGSPGRLPITGHETVLDAIQHAGGLGSTGANSSITLVRPDATRSKGSSQTLPVDLIAIVERGDTTTNYQMMPGDRLIVARPLGMAAQSREPKTGPDIEARLQALEQKLDALIGRLDATPRTNPSPRPVEPGSEQVRPVRQ